MSLSNFIDWSNENTINNSQTSTSCSMNDNPGEMPSSCSSSCSASEEPVEMPDLFEIPEEPEQTSSSCSSCGATSCAGE